VAPGQHALGWARLAMKHGAWKARTDLFCRVVVTFRSCVVNFEHLDECNRQPSACEPLKDANP